MSLHARNIAITAGAAPEILEQVVQEMITVKKIRPDYAETLIKKLSK